MRPEGTLTDLPGRSVGETRGCEYIRGGGGEAERPRLLFFLRRVLRARQRGLTELVFERVRIGTVGVADAACDFVSVTCL